MSGDPAARPLRLVRSDELSTASGELVRLEPKPGDYVCVPPVPVARV